MIVSGTGHRPDKLGGYGQDAFNNLVALAEDWLEENKPTRVISGMALGWDQALARAALKQGIPFIAACPFFGQESKWPQESQKVFNELLKKAEDVLYICDKGYAPWKMQIRNEYMVDHSDVVLALYNGDQSGGTYNCVTYANKHNKPVVNLWEKFNGNQESLKD